MYSRRSKPLINLLVVTFLTPCTISFIVLYKERGIKVGVAINMAVSPGVLSGHIVNHPCLVFENTDLGLDPGRLSEIFLSGK